MTTGQTRMVSQTIDEDCKAAALSMNMHEAAVFLTLCFGDWRSPPLETYTSRNEWLDAVAYRQKVLEKFEQFYLKVGQMRALSDNMKELLTHMMKLRCWRVTNKINRRIMKVTLGDGSRGYCGNCVVTSHEDLFSLLQIFATVDKLVAEDDRIVPGTSLVKGTCFRSLHDDLLAAERLEIQAMIVSHGI